MVYDFPSSAWCLTCFVRTTTQATSRGLFFLRFSLRLPFRSSNATAAPPGTATGPQHTLPPQLKTPLPSALKPGSEADLVQHAVWRNSLR